MKPIKRCPYLFIPLVVTFLYFTNSARAIDIEVTACTKGNLVTREISTTKNQSLKFSYSDKCQPSNKRYQERDTNNSRLIILEFQIDDLDLQIQPETEKKTTKAYLTLSYGPTPAMIHAEADSLRRKSKYVSEENSYSLYTRNLDQSIHNNFFHKKETNFYAVCTDDYCYIKGIAENNKVLYDLHILDPQYRDWNHLHRLTIDLIRKIAIQNQHSLES